MWVLFGAMEKGFKERRKGLVEGTTGEGVAEGREKMVDLGKKFSRLIDEVGLLARASGRCTLTTERR